MPVLALPIALGELVVHGLDVHVDHVCFFVQLLDLRTLLGCQFEGQTRVKISRGRFYFLLPDVLLLRPPFR